MRVESCQVCRRSRNCRESMRGMGTIAREIFHGIDSLHISMWHKCANINWMNKVKLSVEQGLEETGTMMES